jgi:hypothetical protein
MGKQARIGRHRVLGSGVCPGPDRGCLAETIGTSGKLLALDVPVVQAAYVVRRKIEK